MALASFLGAAIVMVLGRHLAGRDGAELLLGRQRCARRPGMAERRWSLE